MVDQVDVRQLAAAQRAPDHLVDRRVAIERQAVRRRPQRQGAGEAERERDDRAREVTRTAGSLANGLHRTCTGPDPRSHTPVAHSAA